MTVNFEDLSEADERRFYCRLLAQELLAEAAAHHGWLAHAPSRPTQHAILADTEDYLLEKHSALSTQELYCIVAGSIIGERLLARAAEREEVGCGENPFTWEDIAELEDDPVP